MRIILDENGKIYVYKIRYFMADTKYLHQLKVFTLHLQPYIHGCE